MLVNRSAMLPLVLFPALLLAAGCGGGGPVRGKVVMNGQPVGGASVTFISEDKKVTASSQTAEDGTFTITQTDGTSLPAGAYKVLVTKMEVVAGGSGVTLDPSSSDYPQQMAKLMKAASKSKPKSLLPPDYSDATKTPVTVTVPPPEGEITIEIKQE